MILLCYIFVEIVVVIIIIMIIIINIYVYESVFRKCSLQFDSASLFHGHIGLRFFALVPNGPWNSIIKLMHSPSLSGVGVPNYLISYSLGHIRPSI